MAYKITYNREDLIWEAVRRNEVFKIDLKNYHENVTPDENSSRLNKHDIFMRDKWTIGFAPSDCNVSVDEIKEAINNGEDPHFVHPYTWIFGYVNEAVIFHNLSKIELVHMEEVSRYVVIGPHRGKLNKFLHNTKERIVVSIEPSASDKEIMKEIQKIKKKYCKHQKEETKNIKAKLYNPLKIERYIGWLRLYDSFVEEIKKRTDEDKIEIEKGAIIKPKDIPYHELIDYDQAEVERDNQIRTYLEALIKQILLEEYKINIGKSEKPNKSKKYNEGLERIRRSEIVRESLNVAIQDIFKTLNKVNSSDEITSQIIIKLKDQIKMPKIENEFDKLNVVSIVKIRENGRRTIANSITGAIQLIQNAPNIDFNMPRT